MFASLREKTYKMRMAACTRIFRANTENKFGYATLLDRRDFAVYKRSIGGRKIEAAYGLVAVLLKGETIYIYPDYRYPVFHKKVKFCAGNFPGLIGGSKISYCLVLPYFRSISKNKNVKSWRLLVVTDRGQIFHNFPSQYKEYDGAVINSDITRFEESVIWDLPGRKYPSPKKEHSDYERYFPGLSDEAYRYHPAVNISGSYANGGFAATKETPCGTLCRFYISRREPEGNPFFYMSGFCADYKMALIATYRSNVSVGVRNCVFASDDGGRQWYCKYEFGDTGVYAFQQGTAKWGYNFGNPILSPDASIDASICLSRRNCVIPNCAEKEPTEKFSFDKKQEFSVQKDQKIMALTSKEPHGYETGNIVAVVSAPKEFDWMVNSEADATCDGNGLFFKVEKIDDFSLRMHEFVASPENPISCRHIHHINRVRDGWLIGTGEIYPNSWLLYMQMKEADTFSVRHASDKFDIFRLNSGENSVQRTLGVIWYDDPDNTMIFASDHDVLEGKKTIDPIDERNIQFSRNATGIYKGKLEDIDDCNKFLPIFEALEPAYLLQKLDRAIVFSGQRGELAISLDDGNTWETAHIDGALNHPRGGTFKYYIFDDYLFEIK